MESALVGAQVEHRQRLHSLVGIVVYALRHEEPVAAAFFPAFQDVLSEVFFFYFGEDGVQSFTDAVEFHHQQRVFFLASRLEVHVYLVSWHRTGHELSVVAQYVASRGPDGVLLVGAHLSKNLVPELALGCHDVERFHHDGDTQKRHENDDASVSWKYFFPVVFTHFR